MQKHTRTRTGLSQNQVYVKGTQYLVKNIYNTVHYEMASLHYILIFALHILTPRLVKLIQALLNLINVIEIGQLLPGSQKRQNILKINVFPTIFLNRVQQLINDPTKNPVKRRVEEDIAIATWQCCCLICPTECHAYGLCLQNGIRTRQYYQNIYCL